MAIWCSNCLRQQKEVKALHETLGEQEGLVTVVLDIDPNEDSDNLRDYAAKHGFDWTYAVAPREVAREIGQLYGDQYLNPPSTPMLIIDQHGEVHLLPFGRKTAEELQQALEPFLTGEM
jgi:peptidoglycan/xylan/chitin deacetylase (PgdA/CDA1 family)